MSLLQIYHGGVARARRKSQWLFLIEQRAGRPWTKPLQTSLGFLFPDIFIIL